MGRRFKRSFPRPSKRVGQVWQDTTTGSTFVFAIVGAPYREDHGWVHPAVALEVPSCWALKPGMRTRVTEANWSPWVGPHKTRLS